MESALRMNAWSSLCISTLSAGRSPRVFTICSRSSGSRSSLKSSTANASITASIDAIASLADLSFASIPAWMPSRCSFASHRAMLATSGNCSITFMATCGSFCGIELTN